MPKPVPSPNPLTALTVRQFLWQQFQRMPKWVQVITYLLVLVFSFDLVTHLYSPVHLHGEVMVYQAADEAQDGTPSPYWHNGTDHFIAHGLTKSATNRYGDFLIPLGRRFLPQLLHTFALKTAPPRGSITDDNVPTHELRVWRYFPTATTSLSLYYVPDSQEMSARGPQKYFLKPEDATAAYAASSSADAHQASISPIPFPAAIVSLAAQETDGPNRLLRLATLDFPLVDSNMSVYFEVTVDDQIVTSSDLPQADSLPVSDLRLGPSERRFRFDAVAVPIPNDGAQVTLAAMRRRFWSVFDSILATCTVAVSQQSLGESFECESLEGTMTASLEIIPALQIDYVTSPSESSPGAYNAVFWLDVDRSDMSLITDVTYDLGPLFERRAIRRIATPLVDEADFYMFAHRLYTSEIPVSATVTLNSGTRWEIGAQVLGEGAIPETAAGHYARAMLWIMEAEGSTDTATREDATREAVKELEEAVDKDPAFTRARAELADALFRLGEEQRGLELYSEAVQPDGSDEPDDALVLNNYAWRLAESDSREALLRARGYAERAVQASPAPPTKDTLGWIRLKLGECEAARAMLVEAREEQRALGPSLPAWQEINYHLGYAYEAIGEDELARQAFVEVVEYSWSYPLRANARYVSEAAEQVEASNGEAAFACGAAGGGR